MDISLCIAYLGLFILAVAFSVYFFSYMKERIFETLAGNSNVFRVIADILFYFLTSIPICIYYGLFMWGNVVFSPFVLFDDCRELKSELFYSENKHHVVRCIGHIKPLIRFTKSDLWDLLGNDKLYRELISLYTTYVVGIERKSKYEPGKCTEREYAIFMLYQMIVSYINHGCVGGTNTIKAGTAEQILISCINELASFEWNVQELRENIPDRLQFLY